MPAVRVSDQTYETLRELAGDRSMQAVLAEAVENLRRRRVLEEYNATYAAIRSDPEAWAEELAERAVWGGTLLDGLEKD